MPVRFGPLRPGIDDRLLVRREPLFTDLLAAVIGGENVLLLGPAGSGKSTALNWLAEELEKQDRRVVFVRASLAANLHELLALIAAELPPVPITEAMRTTWANGYEQLGMVRPGAEAEIVATARQIVALERPEPVTIILDELFEVDIATDLFGRARDALWATGHQWVLAARGEQEAVLLRPPAGAFWATRITVPPLTSPEIAELLELRQLDDMLHPSSFSEIEATPRRVLERIAAAGRGEQPRSVEPRGRDDSPRERLLDALVAIDRPVAVADPELRSRLGWSEEHTRRQMRALVDEGLVQQTVERRSTPGRPRQLFSAHTVS